MASVRERKDLLSQIEGERGSKAILYVTGDRRGLETKIGNDIIDLFVDHLDAIGPVSKISLVLYTTGGNTSAAWNLVNLLQMFCDDLEVIAPGKCMSAGTLIALGADRIVMTKQATLGPIDPSLNHPLGPSIPGATPDARAPVSVEAVSGYLDAAKRLGSGEFEAKALIDLASKVHPLVLGQIFRSRDQIRKLAERLLGRTSKADKKVKAIVDFLCSESGSHDYTINRREAAEMGLPIEKPSGDLYGLLKQLHANYRDQMELLLPFDIATIVAPGQTTNYSYSRALIESVAHGAHHFVSQGTLSSVQIQAAQPGAPGMPQLAVKDHRQFEGWREVT
jgi:hypothetical protein